MTYTIWSNSGKHEYLVYEGSAVILRSGLVFTTRAAAKRAMLKELAV